MLEKVLLGGLFSFVDFSTLLRYLRDFDSLKADGIFVAASQNI
jgi:hypothetical protein